MIPEGLADRNGHFVFYYKRNTKPVDLGSPETRIRVQAVDGVSDSREPRKAVG